MADTQVTNALAFPQDSGTGNAGDADWTSAAYFSMLARYTGGGEYVDKGLEFENIDTGNNQVDITGGHAFIVDDVSISSANRSTNPVVQSDSPTYDTVLPSGSDMPYVVIFPGTVSNFQLESGNNDIYLYVDVTSQNSVYIRYGTSVTNPENDGTPKPSILLGTVDTGSGSSTRANDGGSQLSIGGLDGDITGDVSLTDLEGTNLSISGGSLDASTSANGTNLKSHSLINIANGDATKNQVDRKYGDDGSGTAIYVDSLGHPEGSGKVTNPCSGFGTGCDKIPFVAYGPGGLYVAPGVYDDEADNIYIPYLRGASMYSRFYITQRGDNSQQTLPSGDPADYVINSHLHVGGVGEIDRYGIKGLEVDGMDAMGFLSVLKCNINPASGENYCLYSGGGRVKVEGCNIGTNTQNNYGVYVDSNAHVMLEDCDIDGSTSPLYVGTGAVVSTDGATTLGGSAISGMSNAQILAQCTFESGGMLIAGNDVFVGGSAV